MILRRIFLLGFCTIMIVLSAGAVKARDLHGRLGLGYSAAFSNSNVAGGVPGISLKYGLTRDIHAALIGGISTQSPTNMVTAVKFMHAVFLETNLNFYFFGGGGLVAGGGNTGIEIMGGFGAEFFFPGLESLGFTMEAGLSGNSISGSFGLETIGFSPIRGGIHFYL